MPLLVLALTGSPARAGLVAFAETLPLLVLTLPAGALLDRLDRKRVMLACEAARAAALGSIAVVLLVDRPSFPQILLVALVDGTGYTFFEVAQRTALRQIVPTQQLATAVAQNQAREYGGLLAGPPLGGLLYSASRALPFVFDALSYLASCVSLLFVRAELQQPRERATTRLRADVAEGIRWLWAQPFLRTSSLLVTASDLTVNALYLVVIVIAKEHGASSSLVGLMVAFIGVGGVAGAAIAPWSARRFPPRVGIWTTLWTMTALLPVLTVVTDPIALGVVYGGMFVAYPTWSAVVQSYRAALVPDRLQGRVQSITTLLALGAVPFGSLLVGLALESIGSGATVLVLFGIMVAVSAAAVASPAIRHVPDLVAAADEPAEEGR